MLKFFKPLIIPILFVSVFIGCSSDPPPKHCQVANKFITRFIKDAEKKYNLVCSLEGGEFLGKIKNIHLSFETIGPMSEEKLRILTVQIVEDLLGKINTDDEIREYLVNYPFRSTNLEFRISLRGSDLKPIKNKGADTDLLYGVLLVNGNLIFTIENEEKPYLQSVKRETYEEAFEIVKKQMINNR